MNFEEAQNKMEAVAQAIAQEYPIDAYGLSSPAEKVEVLSSLPGVGIHPTSQKGEFQISIHIAHPDDLRYLNLAKKTAGGDQEVHIEVTDRADAWANGNECQQKQRPLFLGVSISRLESDTQTGTLGCFVRKIGQPNDLYLLSCAHILTHRSDDSRIGDLIIQPGIRDGGSSTSDNAIASLQEFVTLEACDPPSDAFPHAAPDRESPIDVAIAKLNAGIEIASLNSAGGEHIIRGTRTDSDLLEKGLESCQVFKRGRATGLTRGTINSIRQKRYIRYWGRMVCWYSSLLAIEGIEDEDQPFSQPGDSGAVVFDEEGCVIGLLIGGTQTGGKNERGLTYALPIEPVLERLGVEIATD